MRLRTKAWWAAAVLAAIACHAAAAPFAAQAAEARPSTPAQRLERRFLQAAAAGLRFQAEASRLAQTRSNNPSVRDLADGVLARQEAVQPELLHLLDARGMAMPMRNAAHDKALRQLAKLHGAKFDRLYVDEVVLRSCQADIASYELAAEQAEDPVLKAWAGRELPTLRAEFMQAGRALPTASLRGRGAV